MLYKNQNFPNYMHIIALENEPSSRRGGQELNLLEICRGLSKRGHTITLLYLKEGDLLKHYQEFCSQLVNVKTFMLDRHNINYTFNFLADIFRVTVTKNSVVYSNRYQDIFFGFVLSLLNNIPQVCYLQLPPPGGFGRPHTMALKRVKKFIAVSNKTKLDWINSGFKDERIDVVYNGADSAVFKPSKDFSLTRKEWNIPEGTRVISYVGRLDKEKGLETLLKAFAAIVKSGANAKLLIAGKPVSEGEEYKKSLEKLVTDLGIEKYVSFLGHVDNTTSVYQVSDITVLPSLWSEPFGRTVVESMTCGTPVVASRTGGIPEILTKEFQSGLFEAGDERNLADTLNRIINWRDKDRQLGERCREYVLSKFTLDKLVEGIEQVLLGVVKQ